MRVPGRDGRGRVIQQTISYHERAQEAQEALTEYNRLKAAGTTPAADKLSLTVADVFQGWSAREYRKLEPAAICQPQRRMEQARIPLRLPENAGCHSGRVADPSE